MARSDVMTGMSDGTRIDWTAAARELAPVFATRAAAHDADDSFVADNYAELKRRRFFSAPVPAALGGGDASYADVCAIVRTLAHGCGATALALAMHMHPLALTVRRWRDEQAPVEGALRRIAAEELVITSSGGSDWLPGSGIAERVEGGIRVSGRKRFVSGAPAGDLLMTTAVLNDPVMGATVLHVAVPLRGEGVSIQDTWHTLGMRATGSHDVVLDRVFVPDAAITVRRPAGRWVPFFHVLYVVAFPIIFSAYVGVAEAARDLAVREAGKRRDDPTVQGLTGEMDTELAAAWAALRDMRDASMSAPPGPDTTNRVMMARTLAARAAIRTVEKAMELTGGGSFYRSLGLERLYRDVQGARFHPLPEKQQALFSGRLALGLELNEA
jgi:acyl-CoA dehydrogenase